MARSSKSTNNDQQQTSETIYIISNLLKGLYEAKKALAMNGKGNHNDVKTLAGHLEKLIRSLEECEKHIEEGGRKHIAEGGLVKTVIESILPELGINLKSGENPEVGGIIENIKADLRKGQIKIKFEKINETVSNLTQFMMMPQPPIDSANEAPLTIRKINETIITNVVTRLELAKVYSQHQPDNSNNSDKYQSMGKQIKKLTADLRFIEGILNKLKDNFDHLGSKLENFVEALVKHSFIDNLGTGRKDEAKQLQANLHLLNKVVIKLKRQITLENESLLRDCDAHWYTQVKREFAADILPVLHIDKRFRSSPGYQAFLKVYERLELTTRLCLLCFAIIPENEVVKKRFMSHWWVGEGFVTPPVDDAVDRIFKDLVNTSCIEPVNVKHKLVADRYKMDPFIRSAVITRAKEARFFDFDETGNPSANFQNSYRSCLVKGCFQELMKSGSGLDSEKLQVIFNVNVPYPDHIFKLKGFSKLKNVKVLYLGRWQTSDKHIIEVESTKFLKGLKNMKLLRVLSLQGISRISELPCCVCKLLDLRILDLKACHNLEALPICIGSLKRLTHLDISECYMLDYMPKGIATLTKLQVLKGFVISDKPRENSCPLDDLLQLEKLRKLSINIKMEAFPADTVHVESLQHLTNLQKLTIAWATTTSSSNVGENEILHQPPRVHREVKMGQSKSEVYHNQRLKPPQL